MKNLSLLAALVVLLVPGNWLFAALPNVEAPALWSVDTLTKVFANDALPGANAATIARADAMQGEQEPVQLVVGSAGYQGSISVRVEPLVHESGAVINTIDLRLVTAQMASSNTPAYFQMRPPLRAAPATYPDALETNRTFFLAPHSAQPVWATIEVPRNAKPGLYRGDFVVTSTNGESRFPLELRVYGVALPEKPSGKFGTWSGFVGMAVARGFVTLDDEFNGSYDDPRFWDLMEKALINHREHRCHTISDIPFWYMYHLVNVTRQGDGSYRFDYTKFDRFLAMMDKVFGSDWQVVSVGLPLDSKIYNTNGELIGQFPRQWDFTDPAFAEYAGIALNDLAGHLREKGWLDKLYFTYRDEPDMEQVPAHAAVYQKLKELAPELKLMCTLVDFRQWSQMPALDLGVVGWDVANKGLDPVRQQTANGRAGLLYNNYSAMLDLPLLPFRVTAPVVFHTGLGGYNHWAWAWAQETVNSDTFHPFFGPGEGFLVYVTDTPGVFINSIRYEQLREISEDYDLYTMAAEAGMDARSYALRQAWSLTKFSDNTADYFRVRRELLSALEQATTYNPTGPALSGANTIVQWDFNGTEGETPAPSPVVDAAHPTLDGANHGTIAGGSSLQGGQSGFGTALSIAEARVTTTFNPSLINDSQQVTMAAWIKPSVNLSGLNYVLGGASGFLRFNGGILNAGFATTRDWVEVTGGNASSWYTGNWNHVAATFDHGTVSLYVNGVRVASNTTWANGGATINASGANWTGNFNLGGAPWDPDDYSYNGLIDDVRLLTVLPAAGSPAVPSNTVMWWDMNQTSGTNALDGAPVDGANSGTLAGSGFAWTDGQFDGALGLSGSAGYVAAPITGTWYTNQQVGMSAWIKPSTPQTNTYIMSLGGVNGFLRFDGAGLLNGGFATTGGWVEAAGGSNSAWYVGRWNQVATTFSNGTVSLYVNGALIVSNTVPGARIGAPNTFLIGAVPWDLTEPSRYLGAIDDVRLLNDVSGFAAPPVLGITVSDSLAYVYWPATSDPGFLLQTNSNLATTNWGNAGTPFVQGGYNVFTSPLSSGKLFFRLKK